MKDHRRKLIWHGHAQIYSPQKECSRSKELTCIMLSLVAEAFRSF